MQSINQHLDGVCLFLGIALLPAQTLPDLKKIGQIIMSFQLFCLYLPLNYLT